MKRKGLAVLHIYISVASGHSLITFDELTGSQQLAKGVLFNQKALLDHKFLMSNVSSILNVIAVGMTTMH